MLFLTPYNVKENPTSNHEPVFKGITKYKIINCIDLIEKMKREQTISM